MPSEQASRTLYTSGYQGLTIDQFIARLQAAGIETLVDIRATPYSRKPDFSKQALADHLEAAGIAYRHISALGCPKPIRDTYGEDQTQYEIHFKRYLATQSAAVEALAAFSQTTNACLLCFEGDHRECHRSLVAEACQRILAMPVTHLGEAALPAQGVLAFD
ncbi:MAG TPA: DUF488 domain-containing protein [Methylophilaceae bacterium]|nr:DUF488 domain-containing protein [Methylophilaceae bacterium]